MSMGLEHRDHQQVPGRPPVSHADRLAMIEGQIKRYARLLKTLRARRDALAPERVKRKGKRDSDIVFDINGHDVRVTLRREKLMNLLIDAPEGELVPLAAVWEIYGGSPEWARTDLCKFNKRLEQAGARIDCVRKHGYRLVNV